MTAAEDDRLWIVVDQVANHLHDLLLDALVCKVKATVDLGRLERHVSRKSVLLLA